MKSEKQNYGQEEALRKRATAQFKHGVVINYESLVRNFKTYIEQ